MAPRHASGRVPRWDDTRPPALVLLFGGLGRMAARTVVGALSRTSVAIAALMVALAVTIGVSLMISSFRSTVDNWLGLTLRVDLYVSAPQAGGTRPSADRTRALVDRLAAVPGVQEVETFRAVTVQSEFGAIALSVADAAARAGRQALPVRRWDSAGGLAGCARRCRAGE